MSVIRIVVDIDDSRRGTLDLGAVGAVIFTPDGGEPETIRWRKASVVGKRCLRYDGPDGTRVFREIDR